MTHDYSLFISQTLGIRSAQVQAVSALLAEGATVPFIARYRKEATGELDEVQITAIRDHTARLTELDARRETILASLRERERLTAELSEKILQAETLTVLEDLYLPYHLLTSPQLGAILQEHLP